MASRSCRTSSCCILEGSRSRVRVGLGLGLESEIGYTWYGVLSKKSSGHTGTTRRTRNVLRVLRYCVSYWYNMVCLFTRLAQEERRENAWVESGDMAASRRREFTPRTPHAINLLTINSLELLPVCVFLIRNCSFQPSVSVTFCLRADSLSRRETSSVKIVTNYETEIAIHRKFSKEIWPCNGKILFLDMNERVGWLVGRVVVSIDAMGRL